MLIVFPENDAKFDNLSWSDQINITYLYQLQYCEESSQRLVWIKSTLVVSQRTWIDSWQISSYKYYTKGVS